MPGYQYEQGGCDSRPPSSLSELTMSFVSGWAEKRRSHTRRNAPASHKSVWDDSTSTYSYCTVVGASVFVYWLFVSLIPVYNKFFFQKSLYPYPIATAGIQLGVVAVLLAILNTLQHYSRKGYQQAATACTRTTTTEQLYYPTSQASSVGNGNNNTDVSMNLSNYYQHNTIPEESTHSASLAAATTSEDSWIGGPHLLWKLKWVTPIGFLFGLKYGVTNLGLHLVAAPTHLLLQATDLVWTVLSAWMINRESTSAIEMACLVGCIAGSFVLSWHQLHSHNQDNQTAVDEEDDIPTLHPGLFAIIINLLSPMLLGLCIATLRLACCELMRPDNRVRGTVSAVELTTLKLIISSLVAMLLACVMERGDVTPADELEVITDMRHHHVSWWHAFDLLPLSTKLGVMGGAILIAVFQVNCTALTYLTSAVSVGLVGQVKIIPQWIVATIFAMTTSKFTLQRENLIGALLIMASAATFAGSKFWTGPEDECCDDQVEPRPDSDQSTASMDEQDQEDPESPPQSTAVNGSQANFSFATESTSLLVPGASSSCRDSTTTKTTVSSRTTATIEAATAMRQVTTTKTRPTSIIVDLMSPDNTSNNNTTRRLHNDGTVQQQHWVDVTA